jgi:hypothetical protein
MIGDESVVFMFPDPAARTFLTHVIAVSLWPKDTLCAFDLEENPVNPIPLCYVLSTWRATFVALQPVQGKF